MVATAIRRALQQFGGCGCVGRMAQEFGDHSDAAVTQMRRVHHLAGHSSIGTLCALGGAIVSPDMITALAPAC